MPSKEQIRGRAQELDNPAESPIGDAVLRHGLLISKKKKHKLRCFGLPSPFLTWSRLASMRLICTHALESFLQRSLQIDMRRNRVIALGIFSPSLIARPLPCYPPSMRRLIYWTLWLSTCGSVILDSYPHEIRPSSHASLVQSLVPHMHLSLEPGLTTRLIHWLGTYMRLNNSRLVSAWNKMHRWFQSLVPHVHLSLEPGH